jgi:hypothetical protein
MANISDSLNSAMNLSGAIAVALVDLESGMTVGSAGGGDKFNIEIAAAGNTEVVRAKLRTVDLLGLNEKIEDILITLGTQFHIIRIVRNEQHSLYLYLAIDKTRGNLALARLKMAEIEKTLQLS